VWTSNNERGMNETDVRALCDAGNSTKRGESGRIGRKGVGFKSAFKLSSRPHVLSAEYAFRFDIEANGLIGCESQDPHVCMDSMVTLALYHAHTPVLQSKAIGAQIPLLSQQWSLLLNCLPQVYSPRGTRGRDA
jgi:hypothetical protein